MASRQPWACQVEAFDKLKDRKQRALFLEMGMGKTRLEINIIERQRALGLIDHQLVLCPLDLCQTWTEQLDECVTAPVLDEADYELAKGASYINVCERPDKLSRIKALRRAAEEGIFYIIMNYEALVTLRGEVERALAGKRYGVTCDESTFIKHWHTKRTKAAKAVGNGAVYRSVLTGTPIPQGPQDIYGQYWFLDDTIYGPRFVAFRWEYMMINQFKAILGLKNHMIEPFYERLHAPAVVMKKADYSDLPPKIYETIHYELSPEEKAAYKAFAADWRAKVGKGELAASNALTASLRLAQICTGHAGSFDDHNERVDLRFKQPAKIKALAELVDRLEGKFVIWCAWHENVRLILEMLRKKGVPAVDYTGLTKDPRANEMRFRTDPNCRAFVGLPQKGGRGLNLQGPDVKTVIYFSQTYNTEHRLQSEDRVHRGEIKHNIVIFDMICKGTVETTIVRGLRGNKNFQDMMLQDPDAFIEGREREKEKPSAQEPRTAQKY